MSNIERTELWDAPRSAVRMRASMNSVDAAHQIIALEGEVVALRQQLEGAVGALEILNEAMADIACVDWPDEARTYIARAAAALGGQ